MADRSKRLQMMFAGDEALLSLETRLTLPVGEPIFLFSDR
jgi:hypothetical protein